MRYATKAARLGFAGGRVEKRFLLIGGEHQITNAVAQFVLALVAVQLALSVFSRADYLFTDSAVTGRGTMPSDVAQLQESLFLPYWHWGLVCGAVSVIVLALGLRSFWIHAKPQERQIASAQL